MKVGDFVVERLHAWGVRRIYGYPGDGINGLIGALQRSKTIDFIQVRHEEMAAFMAVAHAKFTGEIGVCLSTGGPGATHLITGLYDANWTTRLFWRYAVRPKQLSEAPAINRNSISTACSQMSRSLRRKPPHRLR
jgi:2-succinyl-5-enolpyruvyl-6-hydroxy-3-cyclohexene-1-carboxylate synthase